MNKLRRKILSGIAGFILVSLFSCQPTPEPRLQIGQAYAINGVTYQPQIQPSYREMGYASWYGSRFHRKRTSNGDVFDKNGYTAAHKTLPLPSVVKITNLENGRTLRVIVNDRGPFVRGRIIDVSENAAKKLGFYNSGTAKVLVELDRQASLALLKDPRLKIKEDEKKLLVEAYTKGSSSPSKKSQKNLKIDQQQMAISTQVEDQIQSQTQPSQIIQPSQNMIAVDQPQMQQVEQVGQQTQKQHLIKKNPKIHPPKKPQNPSQQVQQEQQIPPVAITQQTVQIVEEQKIQPEQTKKPVQKKKTVNLPKKPQSLEIKASSQPENQQQPIKAEKIETTHQPSAKKLVHTKYFIQVASTSSITDAKNIASKVKNLGGKIKKVSVNGRLYYKIRVAALNESEANDKLNTIKSIGYKDAFIYKN